MVRGINELRLRAVLIVGKNTFGLSWSSKTETSFCSVVHHKKLKLQQVNIMLNFMKYLYSTWFSAYNQSSYLYSYCGHSAFACTVKFGLLTMM